MARQFTIEVDSAKKTAACDEGQSVLDAFLREDIWVPHSCTQGTCGSCKIKLLRGSVDHRASPLYTLSQEERENSVALACQCAPLSDLTVEPINSFTSDDRIPRHTLADYSGVVIGLEDIASSVRRLTVKLDTAMNFNPGQYAEIVVPGLGVRRQYSISSNASDPSTVVFDVKYTKGGVASEWLFGGAALGNEVAITGPYGQFGLHTRQDEEVIMLAGGTGLAPMKSIITSVLAGDLAPKVYLYHGDREVLDLYDFEYFRDLESSDERFVFRPAVSRGVQSNGWEGRTGRVTDLVAEDFASCKGMSALVCGSPGFVDSAARSLKRRRMAPRLIIREEFTHAIPQPVQQLLG
jgi:NAD(P)H-flavin reductase/ferredoxin